VETLDLLQELLDDYDGTVLLVSHDRDFIDRVATTTVAMEGQGRVTPYAGGWSDYQTQRTAPPDTAPAETKPAQKPATPVDRKPARDAALSFTERHRLAELPGVIDRLGAEIAKLEQFLSQPDLYAKEPVKFAKGTEALADRQRALAAAEEEWMMLEEKAEAS
jgi:ATP-binding cassette subfamily F protein uup